GATEHDGLARLGQPIAQILARTKATTRARYHQGAATFIRFSVIDRLSQGEMHGLVERVELVGPVQRDDAITRPRINEDRSVRGHGLLRNRSRTPISFFSLSKSSAMRS